MVRRHAGTQARRRARTIDTSLKLFPAHTALQCGDHILVVHGALNAVFVTAIQALEHGRDTRLLLLDDLLAALLAPASRPGQARTG